MDSGELSVKITLREIYDISLNTAGKVDSLVLKDDSQNRDIARLFTEVETVRRDVREIQKTRWPLPSLAIVLSIATLIYAIFRDLTGV